MKAPEFKNTKERIQWIVDNKEAIKADKMSKVKHADAIMVKADPFLAPANRPGIIAKQDAEDGDENTINVLAVINTTNIMDSHDDVHLDGIWDESFNNGQRKLHLQEHNMAFDHIISEEPDLKTSARMYSWKDLGYNWEGKTQALLFESPVSKDRNSYMFNQYSKGFVKNHSVGMRYVDIALAVNDPEWEEEYKVWEDNIDKIANKEVAEKKGYFWAVSKADFFEGSAVPLGSNYVTPTISDNKSSKVKDVKVKIRVDAKRIAEILQRLEDIEEEKQTRNPKDIVAPSFKLRSFVDGVDIDTPKVIISTDEVEDETQEESPSKNILDNPVLNVDYHNKKRFRDDYVTLIKLKYKISKDI